MWYEVYVPASSPTCFYGKTEIHQQSKGCKVSSRSPWHLKTSRKLIENNFKTTKSLMGKVRKKKQPKNLDYRLWTWWKKITKICCFSFFVETQFFLEGLFLCFLFRNVAGETTQGTRKRAPLDQSLGQPYQHQMEIQKTIRESKISWKTQKKGIPSRELTYPTWGKGKLSTQKCLGRGYVSSLEGINCGMINSLFSWWAAINFFI